MYRELTIAVVVPAYNESALIAKTIRTMPEFVDFIVVIDDCSTDGTSDKALAVGDPRVRLIRHARNTGVGGAILDGHHRALELDADVSVVMAGDAQMDPRYLPALLDPIADGDAEFTKANRFFSRTSFSGMPKHRVFGSVVLSFMTKASSGYWHLFDPQNGYTATSAGALRSIALDRVATGYEFENDLLIRLSIANVRARDVPIPAVYGAEVSGMRLHKVIPAVSWLLFRGFWKRILVKYVLQSFSPVALLLFAGIALFGFGSLFGLGMTVYRVLGGNAPSAGTVLLAVTPLLAGLHLIISAWTLDIQQAPDRPAWGEAGPAAAVQRQRSAEQAMANLPEPLPAARVAGLSSAGAADSRF
jgi:glycosyltransferase involved in cell wall biosynthesis